MLFEQVLLPKRRGEGTRQAPWRWTGRFRLHDVNGVHQASIGAVQDVEADLRELARDGETLLLRILDTGRRRKSEAPVVMAHVEGSRVICHMRAGTLWTLSHLLGSALPKDGLVTVEAWRDLNAHRTPAELGRERERLEALLVHFLNRAHVNEAFRLREVVNGVPGAPSYRALTRIAKGLVARGVLEMRVERGRRVFVLRRPVHPPSASSLRATA